MSNLAKLRAEGAWGNLASTLPPFTAPAWSTFMTGKDPGQHGVLSFFEQDAASYDMAPGRALATSAALSQRTLWSWLGDAGWRVGIVNVPLTYPPQPVNGFLVTGMLTPIGAQEFTYPPAIAAELGPEYVVEPDYLRGIMGSFDLSQLPQQVQLLADFNRIEAVRTQACLDLIARHQPNFFMVVYASTDRISHFFWDYLGGAHGGTDPTMLASVHAHFRRLDGWLGKLIAASGPNVTVLMMSDHGFGPAARRWAHVNSWLRDQGLLVPKKGSAVGWRNPAYWKSRLGDSHLRRWVRTVLPQRARRAVRHAERVTDLVNWSATQAYFVLIYANVAGVMVNLRGRQAQGVIAPGAEYEAVRDQIIAAAKEWCEPITGRPLVRRAGRREDFYTGEHVSEFPDVILELDPDYSTVANLRSQTVTLANPSFRTGEHRPEGIFLAHGPAIRPGEVHDARIGDLAPTILHLAGVPVPTGLAGGVLTQIFDQEWLDTHPISQIAANGRKGAAIDEIYSSEEVAALTERLAGLGYL